MNNGNIMIILLIPEGTTICNIEMGCGDRGILSRAAGSFSVVINHDIKGLYSTVKLPSGIKKVLGSTCRCILGQVSGGGKLERPLLKAAVSLKLGSVKLRRSWPRV